MYLVIAPIADAPDILYLYCTLFILAGLILYFPLVAFKKHIKAFGKCHHGIQEVGIREWFNDCWLWLVIETLVFNSQRLFTFPIWLGVPFTLASSWKYRRSSVCFAHPTCGVKLPSASPHRVAGSSKHGYRARLEQHRFCRTQERTTLFSLKDQRHHEYNLYFISFIILLSFSATHEIYRPTWQFRIL